MTKDEARAHNLEKADALVAEFEALQELPRAPFKLAPWIIVNNSARFIGTQITIIKAIKDPTNRQFAAAYFRLLMLKDYLKDAPAIGKHPGTK